MADWNPDLYRSFEDERTRPARDLLAQVAPEHGADIVDLGCGPGNSTELLVRRFPAATVTGIDTSEAMLASARERLPGVRFAKHDVATWEPERKPDLIYANAVLQWLPDHRRLFPRLFHMLAPGGVLAVQMPDNLAEPSHRLMREVATAGPWRDRIGDAGAARAEAMLPLASYYDMLAEDAGSVEVWRTVYHHPMVSPAAIVQWVSSTGLRPFVDPLTETERLAFLELYREAIAKAYPPCADGRRLLAFPRIFIVARRTS